MFKKSESKQGDLFKNIERQLTSRKVKELKDPTSWHNVFYANVYCKIEETIFSKLYSERMGRPNSNIRELVSMMILKEGNGWSDEQLFDQCNFNIKVMRALGQHSIDESVPVVSTYYDFRKRLVDYQKETGDDLMKKCFQHITMDHVLLYGTTGKKVRLDSKLINSNLAMVDRTSMILEAIRVFIQPLDLGKIKRKLTKNQYELLEALKTKSTSNILFNQSKAEKENLLVEMGFIIQQLKKSYGGAKHIKVLRRIYKEQYYEIEDKEEKQDSSDNNKPKKGRKAPKKKKQSKKYIPQLKPGEEVPASSVQSIHDPDATFRSKGQGKGKQVISGYHANITETHDEEGPNLIIDVEVEKANVNENEFLLSSMDNSEAVLQQGASTSGKNTKIEVATTDGGYDSVENRKEMSKEDRPHFNLSKLKGRDRRFDIKTDKKGGIRVNDKKLKQRCKLSYSEKLDKYIVHYDGNKKRYFTKEELDNYMLLCKIDANLDPNAVNERANVESTIHQVFHRLEKRNKIKYRSIEKCNLYVISRVLWVNFKRIHQKVAFSMVFEFLMLSWLMNHLKFRFKNLQPAPLYT